MDVFIFVPAKELSFSTPTNILRDWHTNIPSFKSLQALVTFDKLFLLTVEEVLGNVVYFPPYLRPRNKRLGDEHFWGRADLLPLIFVILPQSVVGAVLDLILDEECIIFSKGWLPTNPLTYVNNFFIFVIFHFAPLGVRSHKASIAEQMMGSPRVIGLGIMHNTLVVASKYVDLVDVDRPDRWSGKCCT